MKNPNKQVSEYKDDPREHSQGHTWGWSGSGNSRAGCWVSLSSAPALTHTPPSCQHTLHSPFTTNRSHLFSVEVHLIHHEPSSFCSPLPFPAPPSLLKSFWVFPSSFYSQLWDRYTTCHLGSEKCVDSLSRLQGPTGYCGAEEATKASPSSPAAA